MSKEFRQCWSDDEMFWLTHSQWLALATRSMLERVASSALRQCLCNHSHCQKGDTDVPLCRFKSSWVVFQWIHLEHDRCCQGTHAWVHPTGLWGHDRKDKKDWDTILLHTFHSFTPRWRVIDNLGAFPPLLHISPFSRDSSRIELKKSICHHSSLSPTLPLGYSEDLAPWLSFAAFLAESYLEKEIVFLSTTLVE